MGRPKGSVNKTSIDTNAFLSPDLLFECKTCEEHKPDSEFYVEKQNNNGLRGSCKKCIIAQNSSPKELERKKLYNRKMRREDPRIRMYYAAKHSAKKKGFPFSITVDDIYIPKTCPVFGVPLEVGVQGHPNPNSPSLDRIKPELGYVPGNICVICDRANRIKRDSTIEEIESLIRFLKSFERIQLGGKNITVQVTV